VTGPQGRYRSICVKNGTDLTINLNIRGFDRDTTDRTPSIQRTHVHLLVEADHKRRWCGMQGSRSRSSAAKHLDAAIAVAVPRRGAYLPEEGRVPTDRRRAVTHRAIFSS